MCKLTSITIPGSVTEIEEIAFCGYLYDTVFDTKIDSIYFLGAAPNYVPSMNGYPAFEAETTIYYYKGMAGWTTPKWDFGNDTFNTVELPPVNPTPPPSGGSSSGGGSSKTNASINPKTADFDLNPDGSTHKEIAVTLSNGSYKFSNILLDGKALVKDTDYSVKGKVYSLSLEFLSSLSEGKYSFTFDMNGGTDPVLEITVTDSSKVTPTEPPTPTPGSNPFTDVDESDWFFGAVQYAYDNGIMQGMSNGLFEPNTKLTRAMLVQMLYNYEIEPNSNTAVFTDVDANEWYADAVAWAAGNDIVSGIGGNLFAPAAEITREQMAVMLYNYCVFKSIEIPAVRSGGAFTDAGSISNWAADAVSAMYEAEIIDGKGDGIFDPKGTATRAEVAQLFMNFAQTIS